MIKNLEAQLAAVRSQLDQMSATLGSTAHLHPQVIAAWDALHDAAGALAASIENEQAVARRGVDPVSMSLVAENID